jgi:hypothetical protein
MRCPLPAVLPFIYDLFTMSTCTKSRIVGRPGGVSISNRCVAGACVATATGKRSPIIRSCDAVSVDTSGRRWQVILFCTRSFVDGETGWRDQCRILPSSTSNSFCTPAPSSSAFDRSRTPHTPSLSGGKPEYPETIRRRPGKWVLEGESPHISRTSCLFLTR